MEALRRAGAMAAATCVLAALTLPSAAAGRGNPPPPGPPHADRDGDRVFDDLEVRLRRAEPDDGVRLLVTLAAPPSRERIARLERAVGDLRVRRRFQAIDTFAATATARQARALAGRPGVVQVEADGRVQAANDTARASFGVAEARSDAPAIEGDGDGDPGAYSPGDLVAAVIDTGVDRGHADLDEGKVIAFRDFVNGRTAPYDDNGHGTHVTGTLAGDGDGTMDRRFQGVAPGAAIVAAKVLDANGDGLESDVVAAIDWVVANRATYGIEAINLSLGGDACSDGTDAGSRAVDAAHAAGLVVAVAAGNSGPGLCTVESPGAARGALTVGAMADTREAGFFQAFFSSRGPTADGRTKPDVSAPGVQITSADAGTTNGYATADGTSSATPFVAGVALLMRDANPALGADDVKRLVMDTAVDWGRGGDGRTAGSRGFDIEYGAGRLDAYAAIRAAGAAIDSPPAVPSHRLLEGALGDTGDVREWGLEVVDTSSPVAATLLLPTVTAAESRNPNFDLYLLDPTGTIVARSEFITRQDELGYRPALAGTYRLRVESRRGSGEFYVDVSAGLGQPDTTPPDTLIDSGPTGTTNSAAATFTFHATEPNSTFECRLDAEAFSPCSSPKQYNGLDDGPHRFEVRATDAASNPDPTPAARSWTVDTQAPVVTLAEPADGATLDDPTPALSGGAGTAPGDDATVRAEIYMGTGVSGTATHIVEAVRSGGAWSAQSPPLADGAYTARALQRDAAGNTGVSGAHTFTVDTPAPPSEEPPPDPLPEEPPPPESSPPEEEPPPAPPPPDDGNGAAAPAGATPREPDPSRFAGTAAHDCPVTGTAGADVLDGGLGDDCLDGAGHADTLSGGSGADRLAGGPGVDVLSGGPGQDRLGGGDDRDFLAGDEGDDVLDGGPGSNIADGGIGNDTITGGDRADSLNGGSDEDFIRGGAGDDGITGASGRDRLFGDEGDDRIEGGLGKDHVDGGDGNDNIVAIDGQVDTVECGSGRDVVRADGGDRIARDCERVFARDEGSASGAGNSGSFGDPAGGEREGAAGTAGARAGAEAGGNPVTGDGSAGELRGTAVADTIDSPLAGNLILALAGDDVLAGGSGDDEARGAEDEDVVSGGPGADVLLGGDARDLVSGGPGTDRLDGGPGSNIMNGAGDDDVLIGGDRADSLNGGSDEDFIRGGAGDDGITGASGRDRLFGDEGDDRIEGGLGKDHVDGGDGNDNIVAADGQRDTIRCGRGRDIVRADAGDRIGHDCELAIARRKNAYVVIRR